MKEIDPNVPKAENEKKEVLYNEFKVFLKPVDLGDCVIQEECGYGILTFDFYRVGLQIGLKNPS